MNISTKLSVLLCMKLISFANAAVGDGDLSENTNNIKNSNVTKPNNSNVTKDMSIREIATRKNEPQVPLVSAASKSAEIANIQKVLENPKISEKVVMEDPAMEANKNKGNNDPSKNTQSPLKDETINTQFTPEQLNIFRKMLRNK